VKPLTSSIRRRCLLWIQACSPGPDTKADLRLMSPIYFCFHFCLHFWIA
jgi:hypothetical protein